MRDAVPRDLEQVLAADRRAKATWDDLTPLARRDFIGWIDEARKPETRKRRVDSVPSRLASGKRRPCCYAVIPLPLMTALNADAELKARWQALTADRKRDFTQWVTAARNRALRDERVEQAIAALAAGRQRP
jgi:uncharacterized protein YdeI (YjbR/CyaY-like superfamily)